MKKIEKRFTVRSILKTNEFRKQTDLIKALFPDQDKLVSIEQVKRAIKKHLKKKV